jgi:nucleotide-binding universal stress UspA family protein
MKLLGIRNILVATDLKPDMLPALRSAQQLAQLTGADLHVVHAGRAPARDQHLDERIAALRAAAGYDFDVSLLAGPPAAAVTQEAVRTRADVIVLGHHRNRAGSPGSTADRVVRTARIPCLVLPEPLTLPLPTMLVPVDLSNASGPLRVALSWASALRRRPPFDRTSQTRVDVLHIDSGTEPDASLLARLRDEIGALQRTIDVAQVIVECHVQHNQDIPAAILESAAAPECALLVLGTRAQRVASDVLGSVSSAVTRQLKRPLLLVPPEAWRADQAGPVAP